MEACRLMLLIGLLTLAAPLAEGGASLDRLLPPDRRIAWEPGIPGGIPHYPVAINVRDAPYGARSDGQADDAPALRKAIADCPVGKAVYLPAGTYRLLGTIEIRKGIVLRGAGPGRTVLRNEDTPETAPVKSDNGILHLRGDSTDTQADVTGGAVKDSRVITVDDASAFSAGDLVLLDQDNDPTVGVWPYSYQRRAIGQLLRITRKEGPQLHLNRPLYFTYNPAMHPRLTRLQPIVRAGIEDLTVERANPAGWDSIGLTYAEECWVRNVESRNTNRWHVRLRKSAACEVRECVIHDGHRAEGDCDYGIGMIEKCTDNLIEDNVLYRCRHSLLLEYGGCGNVIGYNYSKDPIGPEFDRTSWLMSDLAVHGGHPYLNLFEGNVGAQIQCDAYLGSSALNTFFRNHATRASIPSVRGGLWAVNLQPSNLSITLLGNVLGLPGQTGEQWRLGKGDDGEVDPRVEATVLRHGNVDLSTGEMQWDSKRPRALPASLYLKRKPSFFGRLPWPAIGPDVKGYVGALPAKRRYAEWIGRRD